METAYNYRCPREFFSQFMKHTLPNLLLPKVRLNAIKLVSFATSLVEARERTHPKFLHARVDLNEFLGARESSHPKFLHARMALIKFSEVQSIPDAEQIVKMLAKISVLGNYSVKMLCNGAFVWATVVLLGAFGADLSPIDFWLVSFILVTQFIRQIVSDKLESEEWKRQEALERFDLLGALDDGLTESTSIFMQITRYLVPRFLVVPFRFSLCMGNLSMCLTVLRLVGLAWGKFDFGSNIKDSNNGRPALLLFYSLAIMEVLISDITDDDPISMLIRMSTLSAISSRIIMKLSVFQLYGFAKSWGVQGILAIHYNMCASIRRGTPIENLKKEVLTFALDLFTEEVQQNCHFGALILSSLARGKGDLGRIMRTETLDSIISKPELVERLLALVSSKKPDMEHFRLAAAQILLELCSVPQYCEIMNANELFLPAIGTLLEDLTVFCPPSSGKKRVQKRRSILEPKLKEIGSEILNPPPPTPSVSSSNAPPPPPPVDVSGFPPEQLQHYRDLALQNKQQSDMIRTLQ